MNQNHNRKAAFVLALGLVVSLVQPLEANASIPDALSTLPAKTIQATAGILQSVTDGVSVVGDAIGTIGNDAITLGIDASGRLTSAAQTGTASVWSAISGFFSSIFSPTANVTSVPPTVLLDHNVPSATTTRASPIDTDAIVPSDTPRVSGHSPAPSSQTTVVSRYVTTASSGLTVSQVIALIKQYAPASPAFTFGGMSGGPSNSDVRSLQYAVGEQQNAVEGQLNPLIAGNFTNVLTVAGVGTSSFAGVIAPNSMYLSSIAPMNTTDLLYNTGNALYWNGSPVAGGTVGNWTSNGTDVYRLTGNVGIGTTSPISILTVDASSTAAALTIRQATSTTSGTLVSFLSGDSLSRPIGSINGLTMNVAGSVTDNTNLYIPQGIYVSGRYAYITNFNGFAIVDVSNPAIPVVIGSIIDPVNLSNTTSIAVAGRYAYVISRGSSSFVVIDISNPKAPVEVGMIKNATVGVGAFIQSVYVSGRYAYLSLRDTSNALVVVDISDPTAPTVVSSLTDTTNMNGPSSVFVVGRYAYVAAQLSNSVAVVDIANPAAPLVVGSLIDATHLPAPSSIYVSGRYAYVGNCCTAGFDIVDVSNPAAPTYVSSVNIPDIWSVYVSGPYAYVVNQEGTISTVDISNPATPTIIGSVLLPAGARGIYVSGSYAYVTETFGNSLGIINLAGLNMPTASIGNLQSNSITTWDNLDVGNNLYVRNGINAGLGGIFADGPLSVFSTTSTSTISTGGFTVGGNQFIVQHNSGNVGIGTSSPLGKLDIEGTGNVIFNTSGNVGIGTLTPAHALDVYGDCIAYMGTCLSATSPTNLVKYVATTLQFSYNSTIVNALTRWMPYAGGTIGTTDSDGIIITRAGLLDNFFANADTNTLNGATTFTVFKNTVSTGVTVTLAAAGTKGSNTSSTITVAAGDRISLQAVTAGTGTLTRPQVSFEEMVTTSIFSTSQWATGSNATDLYYTTGNVGIGTTTPQGLLDVSGSSNSTTLTTFTGGRSISLVNTDTTNNNANALAFRTMDANGLITTGSKIMGVYTSHTANAVSGDMAFLTNNAGTVSEKMRLTAAGNVGIGTTSPFAQLSIAGVAGGTSNLFALSTSTSAFATTTALTVDQNGNLTLLNGSKLTVGGALSVTGNSTFSGAATTTFTGPIGSASGNFTIGSAATTNKILLNPYGGNVGIGTTSPASTLTVVGSACISKGSGATAACSTTAGTITANVFNTAAADLAENYQTTDTSLAAGDIVAVDPNNDSSVVKATPGLSMIGIISTDPGVLLGGGSPSSSVPVALAGRVPVKVSMENGPINRGDSLTISSTPGVAMKAGSTTSVTIGTAVTAASNDGTVTVFVKPGFTDGYAISPVENAPASSGVLDTLAAAAQSLAEWVGQKVVAIEGVFHHVQTDTLDAKTITSQNLTSQNGVQTTDSATGQTYCIRVTNGVLSPQAGACSSTSTDNATPPSVPTSGGTGNNPGTGTTTAATSTPPTATSGGSDGTATSTPIVGGDPSTPSVSSSTPPSPPSNSPATTTTPTQVMVTTPPPASTPPPVTPPPAVLAPDASSSPQT